MSEARNREFVQAKLSRRQFLRTIGAGAVVAALSGCAPKVVEVTKVVEKEVEKVVEVTREVEKAPAAPQIVTIEFANDWNSGSRFQMITDARNMFEDQNPDIRVKMLQLGGGTTFEGGFSDYIVPRFLTGTAPDLIYGAATFIYSHKNYLLDMTDALAQAGYKEDDYYTVQRATHDEQGRIYGLPFNIFSSNWVYNVDLFQQAGVEPPSADWDWNELVEKARKLTDPAKGQYGLHVWNHWEYGYFPLMYSNGARFTNAEFTKTAFNTPDAAEALQWYIDLIYKDKLAPTPEVSTALMGGYVPDVFATGKIGMAPRYGSTQGITQAVGGRFKYSLVIPPKSPKTGKRGAYKGMEPLMAVAEVTKRGHLDAVLKFGMFLIGEEYQTHLSDPNNRVMTLVNKKVTRGQVGKYLEAPPENMKVVSEILDSDYVYDHPMFAKYGEFRQALWTPVDKAFLQEITAAEALAQAETACNQVLQSK